MDEGVITASSRTKACFLRGAKSGQVLTEGERVNVRESLLDVRIRYGNVTKLQVEHENCKRHHIAAGTEGPGTVYRRL